LANYFLSELTAPQPPSVKIQ